MKGIFNKIFLLAILLFCSILPIKAEELSEIKASSDLESIVDVIQDNKNYVILNISQSAPIEPDKAKVLSFKLMQNYFDESRSKVAVIWQNDIHSYGRSYSLAGVYINDFLQQKISQNDIYDYIIESEILPLNDNRHNIVKKHNQPTELIDVYKSYKLVKKADFYRENKNFDSAIRLYQQAIQENPENSQAYFWQAEIYRQQNLLQKAKEFYIKALEYSDNHPAADNALYELNKTIDANENQ